MYIFTDQSLGQPPNQPFLEKSKPISNIQPPRSVAEAIELLEKARYLNQRQPPDQKGALEAANLVHQWISPLRQRFDLYFKDRGVFRGIVKAQEKRIATFLVNKAIDEITTTRRRLAAGVTTEGSWNYTITVAKNARYFLEILADEGVSIELKDAPPYKPSLERADWKAMGLSKSQVRVLWWLRKYKSKIAQAERVFRIDRRAIAGAIAWEALENPVFIGFRFVGPGKVHVRKDYLGEANDDTVAKQVEDAGYLKKVSQEKREEYLRTPEGAIIYIAAIMKAGGDIAWLEHGSDIYKDPCVLTSFYQSKDLKTWQKHLKDKKAKGEQTFVCSDSMSRWVLGHRNFLELAVGMPNFIPKHPKATFGTK